MSAGNTSKRRPAASARLASACLLLAAAWWSRAAQAQTLDYDTFEQVFQEPVTASAVGKPQRASDAPVNMEIITQADIRRSGAITIPDVLQYVAGVDVRRYGAAGEEVGLRGYNQPYNPRLLVLVDGRQVYSDDYGRISWETIPVQLAEIRQIEVIKGPNSALYGFNAVSGVINIITYDPLVTQIRTATLYGGNANLAGGWAVESGRISDWAGLRISVGGLHEKDYSGENLRPADAAPRWSPLVGAASLDGRVRLGPGVEAFLQVSTSDDRAAEDSFAAYYDTMIRRTQSVRAGLNADTPYGLISVSAYHNEERAAIYQKAQHATDFWENAGLSVLQVNDLIKLGTDNTVRVGLDYRYTEGYAPFLFGGTIGYQVVSPSAMWSWQITPRLSLTNAVRYDDLILHYSGLLVPGSGLTESDYNLTRIDTVSFNSGFVFHMTDSDTVRLMAARGAQLPNLVDFALQFPFGFYGPVIFAGNPSIRPSIVENLELDYDRTLPAISSTLRMAAFSQRNSDLISSPFGSAVIFGPLGLPVLRATNVGSSDADGGEIALKGQSASGFRWSANYALAATTEATTLYHGIGALSNVAYRDSVPRHTVNAGIGYAGNRLELDLFAHWQSSYRDFAGNPVGGLLGGLLPFTVHDYVSLSGRAAYSPTPWLTLALIGEQFNAPQIVETAGPLVGRRVFGSVTVRY